MERKCALIISNGRKSYPFIVPYNVQTRYSRFPCNFTNIRHQVIESRLQGRLEIKCTPAVCYSRGLQVIIRGRY